MSAKSRFARLGAALFALALAVCGAQILCARLLASLAPDFASSPYFAYALVALFYVVGLPVFYLIVRTVPVCPLEHTEKTSAGSLTGLYLICMAASYLLGLAGNTLLSIIAKLLSVSFTNPVAQLVDGAPLWLTLAVVCVISPAVEELVFRGLLLGRLRCFGERTAALYCAAVFALFHMNLSQFFYAFAVGYILSLLYLRSGKLLYCIVLHAFVNLTGSVLVPLLAQSGNTVAVRAVGGIVVLLVFLGGGLAIVNRKQLVARNSPDGCPSAREKFLNFGFIAYAFLSLAVCALSFFGVN